MVNGVVAMNDPVPKTDNPGQFDNACRHLGILTVQPGQRLGNDLEFPFHGPAKLAVLLVIGKGPPGTPARMARPESSTSDSN